MAEDVISNRMFSEGYADIAALRKHASDHSAVAEKLRHKSEKSKTAMMSHQHSAVQLTDQAKQLRETVARTREDIKTTEQELKQASKTIDEPRRKWLFFQQSGQEYASSLRLRIQRMHERAAKLQRKATRCDQKAVAHKAKAAQLKVASDRYLEQASAEDVEASGYTRRADRLQRATDRDTENQIEPHL